MVHHPVMQKEVDELIANDAIYQYNGGADFYSNVYVVPKHMGELCPILNLMQFSCYIHLPTFKVHTTEHIWQFIKLGDYAFFVDLKNTYLHIPIVERHLCLLYFAWEIESS